MRTVLSFLLSGLLLGCSDSQPVAEDKQTVLFDSAFDYSKLDCERGAKFLSSQELEENDLLVQVFDSAKSYMFRKTMTLPDSVKSGNPIRFAWDQKTAQGRMLGAGKYTLKYTYVDKSGTPWNAVSGCQEVAIRVGDYAAYEHLTQETHGIPKTFYRAVAVDSKNTVWFITSDHLIRYDGEFDSIPNPLPTKFMFKLAVNGKDEPVVMFSSTASDAGGVVAFYDGGWTYHDHSNSPIPDRNIFRAFASIGGELWISTADGVLSFKDSEWIPRHRQNPLFAKGASAFGQFDSRGIYMGIGDIATSYQLYFYDGVSLNPVIGTSTRFPDKNQIFSLDFAQDGTLWIAMREYLPANMEGGLVKFQNNQFVRYSAATSELPGNAIEIALATGNGKVVLATDGFGVGLFDGVEYETILDGIDVTDMEIGPDGDLWVTTFAHGIYRFPYNHQDIVVSIANPKPE